MQGRQQLLTHTLPAAVDFTGSMVRMNRKADDLRIPAKISSRKLYEVKKHIGAGQLKSLKRRPETGKGKQIMENNEKITDAELAEEELDEVTGGVSRHVRRPFRIRNAGDILPEQSENNNIIKNIVIKSGDSSDDGSQKC